jgi:hypothetical protein
MRNIAISAGCAAILFTTVLFAETAGTVNGMEISVAEANKALAMLTRGQTTWSGISRQQKEQVLKMIAPSKLAAVRAKKELSAEEKRMALSNLWMQKKISQTEISDDEAKKSYEALKKAAKKENQKKPFPPYESVKREIKMKMAQEKVVSDLIKHAKIRLK